MDLQLWPLNEDDSMHIALDLLQRMGKASRPSARLPDTVLVLIRLLGGNPQLLAWALVALSGQDMLLDEAYIAGVRQYQASPSLCSGIGYFWHIGLIIGASRSSSVCAH